MSREFRRLERRHAQIESASPSAESPAEAQPTTTTNGAASTTPSDSVQSAPATRSPKIVVGTEGERRLQKGRHTGDRTLHISRPRLAGFRAVEPGIIRVEKEREPADSFGRGWRSFKRLIIGAPIMSAHESHERLTKVKGLAVFASDNISSSAYASEEIMRVLALVSVGALSLTLPLTFAIVGLLAIVTMSYQQTIRMYPNGGGSYIVASDNLGAVPGLVAGSALLIDYVLTVSVSISAGVAALTSLWPQLYPFRVEVCVAAIALIALGNLRGVRESGSIFAVPVYVYLVAIFGVLAYGLFRFVTGDVPLYEPIEGEFHHAGRALGVFLILRAFASGAVALTGVEAVSNGIPAFKAPETHNARITLIWMASLFATIFVGLSFLANWVGIVPDPNEVETVISQLTRSLVGTGPYWFFVQISTAVLLLLAANTSFADFPRLASIMARDKFLPSQFSFRGERLAFSNGIIALAVVAAALVVGFQGSVTNLIPLYTVGVFVAFTLSQSGMVKRWLTRREPGWHWSIVINAVGATITAVVAVVVGITKFALGAWVVLVLIPLLVVVLLGIRKHYFATRDQLAVSERDVEVIPDLNPEQINHTVVIPVADLNRAALRAVAYTQSLTGHVDHPAEEGHAHVVAVHITDDVDEADTLKERWDRVNTGVDLVIIESPYRALTGPLLTYVDALERQHPAGTSIVTVLLPEYIPAHWWEHLLHTQTALRLKAALLFRPRTAVASVPYHLEG